MKNFDRLINDNDFELNAADSIQAEIELEMRKAEKDRDYDRIAELSAYWCELIGDTSEYGESDNDGIEDILSMTVNAEKKPKRHTVIRRAFISVACAAVLLLSVNLFTVSAFNMNFLRTIIHYSQGGFSVEFTEDQPNDKDDKYGIKAECAKYGIYPEIPHYLPEGFELESIEYLPYSVFNGVEFRYIKSEEPNEIIIMCFDLYDDIEKMKNVKIPSDYYNIDEIQINGKTAITSKEDNQYTLLYVNDYLMITIFTQDVPYDECDKIAQSIR